MATSLAEAFAKAQIEAHAPTPSSLFGQNNSEPLASNPREIAEQMDAIMRIFFDEHDITDDEDRDIQPELRARIWQIRDALGKMNTPNEIVSIYLQFKKWDKVEVSQLEWLSGRVHSLAKQVSLNLVDFSRELFGPFSVKASISSSGTIKEIDMLDLALSRRGGFWISHLEEYSIQRPKEDGQVLTTLKTEIDTSPVETSVVTILDMPSHVPNPPGSKVRQAKVDRRNRDRDARNLRKSVNTPSKEVLSEEQVEKLWNLLTYTSTIYQDFQKFLETDFPLIPFLSAFYEKKHALREVQSELSTIWSQRSTHTESNQYAERRLLIEKEELKKQQDQKSEDQRKIKRRLGKITTALRSIRKENQDKAKASSKEKDGRNQELNERIAELEMSEKKLHQELLPYSMEEGIFLRDLEKNFLRYLSLKPKTLAWENTDKKLDERDLIQKIHELIDFHLIAPGSLNLRSVKELMDTLWKILDKNSISEEQATELENISQASVRKIFDKLKSKIEATDGKISWFQIYPVKKEAPKKRSKPVKGDETSRSMDLEKPDTSREKIVLQIELKKAQIRLRGYEQYWKEKESEIKKEIIKIGQAIDCTEKWNTPVRTYQSMTQVELEKKRDSLTETLSLMGKTKLLVAKTFEHSKNSGLSEDIDQYQDAKKLIASIQKKIQRI